MMNSENAVTSGPGLQPFGDLVSVRDAAKLLRVSESTVWRWINQDVLPAYRVGYKRVWLRRSELELLVAPARTKGGQMAQSKRMQLFPMAPERRRIGDAIAKARALQAELLAKRGGKPFPESWQDINEARERRPQSL